MEVNWGQTLIIIYIIFAFLSPDMSEISNIERFNLETVDGKLETAKLKLNAHYYHYLSWTIVSITLVLLSIHFQNSQNSLINILVMFIILISILQVIRYLFNKWIN